LETKVCIVCKIEKDESAFSYDKSKGRSNKCKTCATEYNKIKVLSTRIRKGYGMGDIEGSNDMLDINVVNGIVRDICPAYRTERLSVSEPSVIVKHYYENIPPKLLLESDIRKIDRTLDTKTKYQSWIELSDIDIVDGKYVYIFKQYASNYSPQNVRIMNMNF